MTNATTLSARIAALEAQAAPLPELNAELAQLLERCNVVSAQIQDATRAQHLLAELEGHAARLFDEPANSASISGSIRADPAQSEATEPQSEEAETPASTAEVLVEGGSEPSINSESNSETYEYRSHMDVLIDWAAQLAGAVTTHEAADQTGVPWGTVKNYLPALVKKGLLEREPGSGTPHNPSRYRRPQPAPAPRPKTVVRDDLPKALPTDRDLPPLVQSNTQATQGQMEAVQIALAQHGRPMSRSLLLGRVAMKACALDAALQQLEAAGHVAAQDGRYALAGRL